MSRPKSHLSGIYRPPPDKRDRLGFLRLDKNEDVAGLPQEFIQKVLSQVTPDFLSSYPHTYKLYEALSRHLSIGEDHLLVTAGSDAAIKTAFETYVGPGDEVIIPDPTFAMFEVYAHLFNANLIKIGYLPDLTLPIEEILETITKKTKLICLPNPNSPTGTIVKKEDLLTLLKKAGDSEASVLVDEAYFPFHPETAIDLIDEYPNLMVTRTFSKAFGLASIRLGFTAAQPETIKNLTKFRPMYEVNSFAVLLGTELLKHPELMEKKLREVEEGKKYIEAEMKHRGYKTHQTHTNFIHIEVGEEKVKPLMEHMQEAGILVRTCPTHETLKRCIRITLGPVPLMAKAVDAITKKV